MAVNKKKDEHMDGLLKGINEHARRGRCHLPLLADRPSCSRHEAGGRGQYEGDGNQKPCVLEVDLRPCVGLESSTESCLPVDSVCRTRAWMGLRENEHERRSVR